VKVLVVDDERVARERLVRMLRRIADVEIAGEARDGDEALAMIETLRPDLVLLDVRMPGTDGLGVVRRAPWLPPSSSRPPTRTTHSRRSTRRPWTTC
jgi:YesN/AraC family two-component response regulator